MVHIDENFASESLLRALRVTRSGPYRLSSGSEFMAPARSELVVEERARLLPCHHEREHDEHGEGEPLAA